MNSWWESTESACFACACVYLVVSWSRVDLYWGVDRCPLCGSGRNDDDERRWVFWESRGLRFGFLENFVSCIAFGGLSVTVRLLVVRMIDKV